MTSNGLTIPTARIKPSKKARCPMERRQPMGRSCELEKLRQGPGILTADEHS